MTLLGLDVGTTHCKAALFDDQGELLYSSVCPTPTDRDGDAATHDPQQLWSALVSIVRRLPRSPRPDVVGVASMAEAGLLVDRSTGTPRTPIIAWYDTRSTPQSEDLARRESAEDQFRRTGLHPSFKYGLSKILWLRQQDPTLLRDAVWLSVGDYVVYRLTGEIATDPSLAARTYAFSVLECRWDCSWINSLDLDQSLFPQVLPSGVPAGRVTPGVSEESGLPRNVPVAVAGHDHVCAMLAAGIVEPGPVLDSMGTAESLIAVATDPRLGPEEMASGLALVPHVLRGTFCWLGGLSAAGGSMEWARRRLVDEGLSYEQLEARIASAPSGPTSVLYFPYLLGSGAPHPDRRVRAAFMGLDMSSTEEELLKAVWQGVAFEAESIRLAVEKAAGRRAEEVVAVGGGTRSKEWLKAKAGVSARVHRVPALPEATALGAAFTAGLGSGTLSGVSDVVESAARHRAEGLTVEPDRRWTSVYQDLYRHCYLPLREPLHAYGRTLAENQARWAARG